MAHKGDLSECISPSNCVLINWEVDDVKKSFQDTLEVTQMMPRTKIVEIKDGYMHAEVTSKIMHYIDDFEVMAMPNQGSIQIRSESRVGIGDFGVNRKRVINFLNNLSKS